MIDNRPGGPDGPPAPERRNPAQIAFETVGVLVGVLLCLIVILGGTWLVIALVRVIVALLRSF